MEPSGPQESVPVPASAAGESDEGCSVTGYLRGERGRTRAVGVDRLAVLAMAALLAGSPSAGSAGPVSNAAQSAAARSAAAQSRAAAEQAAVRAAQRAAWQRVYREGDEAALQAIHRRFGAQMPSAQRLVPPARLLTPEEFDRSLARRAPHLSAEERSRILGYQVDGQLYVNVRQQEFFLTLTHERLHQLAHPRFRQTFGNDINEGVTERFARMSVGDMNLKDLPAVYTAEMRLADMLIARVGPERIARAYFQGDPSAVQSVLRDQLGDRGLRQFAAAVQRADREFLASVLQGN